MSGKPGMRERWSNPAYADACRAKIRAGMILNRLNNHILGKVEMSATQLRAAEVLLRKVLADKSEQKIDATIRTGPLLSVAQAAEMAEAMIESAGRTTAGAGSPSPVRHSEPA